MKEYFSEINPCDMTKPDIPKNKITAVLPGRLNIVQMFSLYPSTCHKIREIARILLSIICLFFYQLKSLKVLFLHHNYQCLRILSQFRLQFFT